MGDHEAQAAASREGVRLSMRWKSCARFTDVVPYCPAEQPSQTNDEQMSIADGGTGARGGTEAAQGECSTSLARDMARDRGLATGLCGQPGIAEYLEKCRIPYRVISRGREQARVSGAGNPPGDPAVKSEWGENFPHSVGLNHDEPSLQDVLRFYDNMLGCSEGTAEVLQSVCRGDARAGPEG